MGNVGVGLVVFKSRRGGITTATFSAYGRCSAYVWVIWHYPRGGDSGIFSIMMKIRRDPVLR